MRKIFSILFISFIIFSCDQENIIVPTDKTVETNPVLERMRERGYDMNTVVDYNDEYYLVEGDIMISKNEKINTSQRHINLAYEFNQKRPIRLFLDNNFTTIYNDMSVAVDNAIYFYNHVQGARLTIERTYKKDLADLVITQLDREDTDIVGVCYNWLNYYITDIGLTANIIDFNERSILKNKFSVSQITFVVVHEIGHSLGRMHTDTETLDEFINIGYQSVHNVPGSPSSDKASVMLGASAENSWNGFSHWDVISLRRLFPAISKSDVSLIYINRFADNTWSFGMLFGQERYQYNKEYKNQYMGKIDDNWDFCAKNTQTNRFYGIHKKNTASGMTEIVINNMIPFRQTKVVTPLHLTNANWTFVVGDYNKDGKDDIFCINRYNSESQKTTIHILNGATNYSTWLTHVVTPLYPTNSDWDFISGDVNNDGKMDVICIFKQNITTTTIHVLNGATNYSTWLSHAATPLHNTGANFEFFGGDYNNDGRTDVYAIKKWGTGTNSTEIHILNGANNFQNYLVQIGTSLPEVSGNVEFCN